MKRVLAAGGLVAVLVGHNAWWIWDRSEVVWGLPVGLLWEIVYCGIATVALAAAVKFVWPRNLDEPREGGR